MNEAITVMWLFLLSCAAWYAFVGILILIERVRYRRWRRLFVQRCQHKRLSYIAWCEQHNITPDRVVIGRYLAHERRNTHERT